MNIELKGTVKDILQEVQINDNISKKEIVITIEGDTQYPQDIIVQSINTKIEELKGIIVGDNVVVSCTLRGNKSKDGGKYFNQISLWRLVKQSN